MKNKVLLTIIFASILQFGWAVDVKNQGELLNALNGKETTINITANFKITTTWISKDIEGVTINGNDHTISMNVDTNPALFDVIDNCKIYKLKLVYHNQVTALTPSKNTKIIYIGSFANQSRNSEINRCLADFNLKINLNNQGGGTTAYVGGIVGYAENTKIINTISYFIELSAQFPQSDKGVFITGGIAALIKGNSELSNNVVTDLTINGAGKHPDNITVITGNIGNIEQDSNIIPDTSLENDNVFIPPTPPTEGETTSPEKPSIDEIEDIIINTETKINIDLANPDKIKEEGGIIVSTNETTITIEGETSSAIMLNNSTNLDLVLNCKANVYCNKNTVKQLTIGAETKQSGIITCNGLTLMDGCQISENEINNTGFIHYYRTPQVWTGKNGSNGSGDGWETLCLPFDAKLHYKKKDGTFFELPHYKGDNTPFYYWLKSYTQTDNSSLVFATEGGNLIQKNKPYIISMPGSAWGSSSLENRILVFIGEGAISGNNINSDSDFKASSYTKTEIVENRLFLNSPGENVLFGVNSENVGNTFKKASENEQDVSLPFRATASKTSPSGASFSTRNIVFSAGSATQVGIVTDNKRANIHAYQGEIFIESECPEDIIIYQISGIPVRKVRIEAGTTVISDLEKGVYIIAGKKIVL